MVEEEWNGGRGDSRPYKQVRCGEQKVVAAHYEWIRPFLNERGRRLWAANEALRFGRGGIRAVAEALKWTSKSLENIREELGKSGYKVSATRFIVNIWDTHSRGSKKTKEGS